MANAELRTLEKNLEEASAEATNVDAKVASVFGSMVEKNVKELQSNLGHIIDAAALVAPKEAIAFRVLGKEFINLLHQLRSNPPTFISQFAHVRPLTNKIVLDMCSLLTGVPGGRDLAKALFDAGRGIDNLERAIPFVESAIASVQAEREAYWAARKALDNHLRQNPVDNKVAKYAQADRLPRTRLEVSFCRVYAEESFASIRSAFEAGKWDLVINGPPAFFFLGNQLNGLKTAQEVIVRGALEYNHYKNKDLIAPVFKATVSFVKGSVNSSPTSPADWLKVLNRLNDYNASDGQQRTGGNADERIIALPSLETVRLVAMKRYPWAGKGKDDRQLTREEREANASEQKKLNNAVSKHNLQKRTDAEKNAANASAEHLAVAGNASVLARVRRALDKSNRSVNVVDDAIAAVEKLAGAAGPVDTSLKGFVTKLLAKRAELELQGVTTKEWEGTGQFDAVIRRGLSSKTLAVVEQALEAARQVEAHASGSDKVKASTEVMRLQERIAEIVKHRELVPVVHDAMHEAKHGKLDVNVQDNEASDQVSSAHEVTSKRIFSVYAKTPADVGGVGQKTDRKVGAGLAVRVQGNEKKPVPTAGGLVINQVDVAVVASGQALKGANVAHAGAAGAEAGKVVGGALPLKEIGFRDVLGGLVRQRTQDIFRNTVGKAAPERSPAKGGDPLVPFGRAMFKKKTDRKASLSDEIAKRRSGAKAAESLLIAQVSRLESASSEARPLIGKNAAQLHGALARLDVQIAALKGARGQALAQGARGVGQTLGQMASIARKLDFQSAGTVRTIQGLINQRRDALAKLASGLSPDGKASPQEHRNLDKLSSEVPGLEKVVGKKKPNKKTKSGEEADAKAGRNGKNAQGDDKGRLLKKQGLHALADLNDDKPGRKGKSGSKYSKGKGRGALSKAYDGYMKKGRGGLIDTVAPGASKLFSSIKPTVNRLFEALRGQGHTPRLKGWFSDITTGFSKVTGGLSRIKKGVVGGISALAKKGFAYSPLGLAVKGAQAIGGLAKAAINTNAVKALASAVSQNAKGALSFAKGVAKAGLSSVKKTAQALGGGMAKVFSAVGSAAAMAWDSTKHAVKTIGNGALAAANKTGGFFKGLWSKATGVVGAINGKIKSGISSAASWVGQKANKVGGALMGAAKFAGKAFLKHTPLGQALKFGWDKFGQKAWDKTKSFASVAWQGAKKFGKAAGNFLQSPAGQLLTTGLSIAASFIPGGMLIKAGIGAVMGAIDAVSKGGGWKEALIGAGTGALEGALPFLKLGVVGKLALSGVKGGLQSAVSGGSFGDIAKGALGGAFDVGGLGAMKKFGGGRAFKMADKFMAGGSKHKGVLGKLQKVASKGALAKVHKGAQKAAPKIVKGTVWAYDKTGKLHKVLDAAETGGEYAKGALEGLSGASKWAQEQAGDGAFGEMFGKVSELSGAGAEKLGMGLAYVTAVDDVVEQAHGYLGAGLKHGGIRPGKAVKQMHRKQELQRKHSKKLNQKLDAFDRVDNFFHAKSAPSLKKSAKLKSGVEKQVKRYEKGFGNTHFGKTLVNQGGKLLQKGVWTYGQLSALKDAVDKGVAAGEQIQSGLQNLIILTENTEQDQLGGSLKWLNDTAVEWEQKIAGGLELVKQVQSVVDIGHGGLQGGLKSLGVKDKRLDAAETKAKVSWGLEEADEEKTPVAGGPAKKVGKDEVKTAGTDELVVAPWSKWTEKQQVKEEVGEDAAARKATLDRLNKWRANVKKSAAKVAKKNEQYAGTAPEVDAGLRLLGAEAGDQETDWAAYKARQEKKGATGKPAQKPVVASQDPNAAKAHLDKAVGESMGKKLDEVGASEAKDVHQKESAALAQIDQGAIAPAGPDLAEGVQAPVAPTMGLDDPQLNVATQTIAVLNVERGRLAAEARKSGNGPQRYRAQYAQAMDVVAQLAFLESRLGRSFAGLRSQATDLATFFNGGESVLAQGAKDQAQSGLENLASPDGIVGEPAPQPTSALELLEGYGNGFSNVDHAAMSSSNDVVFGRLAQILDAYEGRVRGDLPRVEQMLTASPDEAKNLHYALVREGRVAEFEIERLGNIVDRDPGLSRGLATHVSRYLRLLKAVDVTRTPAAAGEADPALEGALEGQQNEAPCEAPGEAPAGQGNGVPAVATAVDLGEDEGYLGETFEDTYISSGAAARPIADGLANNFHFDEQDVGEPTIGGALSTLGGALTGLGGSLSGAAGDLAGIADEVKLGAAAFGGISGDIGELVGQKDNAFTQGAAAVGEFAEKGKGALSEFDKTAQKLSKWGGKVAGFGDDMKEKGFRGAVGKAFKKGRNGHEDTAPAPVVDAGRYSDGPRRLDFAVMSNMERFLGARLGDVKIHTGAGAAQITKRFDAEAVTIREHIFFAPGRFQPASTDGRKLLAHELTHVAQRGRPNLDTRTAEEEAHRAEAAYGTPGMETLDLSTPQADFTINMAGAEHGKAGVRTAKEGRSVAKESSGIDEQTGGEELLDLVGERVYQLLIDDLEKEFENR